ncbi:MAG: copper oxidase [Candidatus Eremiobacter antarcticus]|nr:multicopper oxidase domain-containing protein [Candidatus Eremiobacteraeota bacterium]MBC5807221.1 multicopper oxidase domain-containing protein [Candidatus Eremiobacteraeota bacterium]PZR61904.1 MAG: copper oxidase [Candidatus Eremiobacter sp. RRmetagenome_bin22]
MSAARSAVAAVLAGIAIASAVPCDAAVRTYFIAADDVLWNFAPSGHDLMADAPLPKVQSPQLGWRYHKALYRAYTDATFRHLKARRPSNAYLGLLGPIIRAEVGDTIVVTFKNNTRLHLSVHPYGVEYDKASEGAPYRDGSPRSETSDDAVAPGGVYAYRWAVPERSGPGPMDPSSVLWMYYSHTDEVRDVSTGPIGPIIITRRGMARADGSPQDVDSEFVAMFSEVDESQSRLIPENLRDASINPHHISPSAPAFQPSNQFFTINGFVFGNLPMLTMTRGQRVRWYLMSSMSDFDFHAPTWHGQTVLYKGQRSNTLALGPTDSKVADMVPENPGVWEFDCDLNIHHQAGMSARFTVLP